MSVPPGVALKEGAVHSVEELLALRVPLGESPELGWVDADRVRIGYRTVSRVRAIEMLTAARDGRTYSDRSGLRASARILLSREEVMMIRPGWGRRSFPCDREIIDRWLDRLRAVDQLRELDRLRAIEEAETAVLRAREAKLGTVVVTSGSLRDALASPRRS